MASPAAAALDAADGVMDGKHFGRPIVQAGAPAFGGFAQPAFGGFAQSGFGGFAQPGFGGFAATPTVIGGYPQAFGGFAQPATFAGGASSAALALDAADGVIDGKSFGRPIVQAGAPAVFGGYPQFVGAQTFTHPQAFGGFAQPAFGGFAQPATFVGGASSAALALDAADGVIDGKSFGRPIVQAGAPAVFGGYPQMYGAQTFAHPQAFGGFAQPAFGGFAQPATFAGGASSAALALDAADGVIDGKSFGRPIVQAGGLVPYTGVAAAPQYAYGGVPTFAAAPQVFGGAVPAQFYGQRFATAGYPTVGAYPGYAATYGAPTVGRFAHPGSAAQRAAALDAADGVMDGKHFGRPIVQQRRR